MRRIGYSVEVCCPSLNRHVELTRLHISLPNTCIFTPKMETRPRALPLIVNELFVQSKADIVIMAADHLTFEIGCIDEVRGLFKRNFKDTDGVVGLNMTNVRDASEYCFPAVGRKFMERFKDNGLFCPDYYHFYGDTEFGMYAEEQARFVFGQNARVYSFHPNAGNTQPDATHRASRAHAKADEAVWKKRQKRGLLWGRDWEQVNASETITATA